MEITAGEGFSLVRSEISLRHEKAAAALRSPFFASGLRPLESGSGAI
jgi:hypothetical protein